MYSSSTYGTGTLYGRNDDLFYPVLCIPPIDYGSVVECRNCNQEVYGTNAGDGSIMCSVGSNNHYIDLGDNNFRILPSRYEIEKNILNIRDYAAQVIQRNFFSYHFFRQRRKICRYIMSLHREECKKECVLLLPHNIPEVLAHHILHVFGDCIKCKPVCKSMYPYLYNRGLLGNFAFGRNGFHYSQKYHVSTLFMPTTTEEEIEYNIDSVFQQMDDTADCYEIKKIHAHAIY